MTPFQEQVMRDAEKIANRTLAAIEQHLGGRLVPAIRSSVWSGLIGSQLALAREVAQHSANERAQIARMEDAEILDDLKERHP